MVYKYLYMLITKLIIYIIYVKAHMITLNMTLSVSNKIIRQALSL